MSQDNIMVMPESQLFRSMRRSARNIFTATLGLLLVGLCGTAGAQVEEEGEVGITPVIIGDWTPDINFYLLAPHARIIGIEEVIGAKSGYANPDHTLGVDLNRHVARALVKVHEQPGVTVYPGEAPPPPPGSVNETLITHIDVDAPAEVGWVGATQPTMSVTMGTLNPYVPDRISLWRLPSQQLGDWTFYVQLGVPAGVVPGSNPLAQHQIQSAVFYMRIYVVHHHWIYDVPSQQWQEHFDPAIEEVRLDFKRLDMSVTSMDSRKTFGQPGLDGELPGDPNADLRVPSFNPWLYKGGHFVGSTEGTNDLSGKSRTQGVYTGTWPTSTYVAGCLTLFPMTKVTNSPNLTLGFAAPSATDPFYNLGVQNMKWDTKWLLTEPLAPNTTTYPKDVEITDAERGKYLNVPFKFGTGGECWPKIAFMLVSPANQATWQYFASSFYGQQNVAVGYPLYDAGPRQWRIGYIP